MPGALTLEFVAGDPSFFFSVNGYLKEKEDENILINVNWPLQSPDHLAQTSNEDFTACHLKIEINRNSKLLEEGKKLGENHVSNVAFSPFL